MSGKETMTIDVMFKKQVSKIDCQKQVMVQCPACGTKLPENKLNLHLDTICPSNDMENKPKCQNFSKYNEDTGEDPRVNSKINYLSYEKMNDNLKSCCTTSLSMNSISSISLGSFQEDATVKKPHKSRLSLKRSLTMHFDNKNMKNKYLSDTKGDLSEDNFSNCIEPVSQNIVMDANLIRTKSFDNNLNFNGDLLKSCHQQSAENYGSNLSLDKESEGVTFQNTDGASISFKNDNSYYWTNFKHVIDSVLGVEDDFRLFNEDDKCHINTFQTISEAAQKLYIRLFQRKYNWLRPHKMNYAEIGENLVPFLDELVGCKFLLPIECLEEMETALGLMSAHEIKKLGKDFNLNIPGKNKKEITDMLLKHGQQQKPLFGTNVSGGVTKLIMRRVTQIIGSCYKLSPEPRKVFVHIMVLFSLPFIQENENNASGGFHQQLFTLLLVNRGNLVFPEYKVLRQAVLFKDRDDLIRYETAKQLENEIDSALESKDVHLAYQLYQTAEKYLDQYSQEYHERDATLPHFLRCFTAGHVYVKCLSKGVEILQKLKKYKEAVEVLQKLLNQMIYCQDYRGRWWDRLALNLDQHLKEPEKSLSVLHQGIADQEVRTGHRFSLFTRVRRLHHTLINKNKLALIDFEIPTVREAHKVIIQGCLLPHSLPGRKHVFISKSDILDSEASTTLLSVEELALKHYRANGFKEGIHGEGSTLISLFGLMFWDIIYGEHPDVFRSPYHTYPLDLNSDHFYATREHNILDRLGFLRNSAMVALQEHTQKVWQSEEGKSSLVSWEKFSGYPQVQGLIACMGKNILAGVCERLAKDFRHCRSGVPDLVVWNPDTLNLKIVEVKGPGDHLSPKQVLWLDYLLELGTDAEVCHVEATSSKRLKRH